MTWWLFFQVFFLSAGFVKLLTMLLNRLQSIPQPKWLLITAMVIHFLLMPIYSLILISNLSNPLSWFDAALMLPGLVGLAILVASVVSFQQYRPPQCQNSNDSKLVDFRQSENDVSWQNRLIGQGKFRRLAFLPRNEQFTLEVSTKTYVLPRLPKEWDGFSIVQLADTHFLGAVSKAYFEAVCEQAASLKPDLFVFTGDLLDTIDLLHWVPETLGRLRAPSGQYFVLGNHDWYLGTTPIRAELERHGWIDLAGQSLQLHTRQPGPPIVLAGDETPWMGQHPDLSTSPAELFRILFSHTPDNFRWAQKHGVDLMFAGHTHGGQIRLPLLGPVYSPSRFGCRYSSGVFWCHPTLMYVSRGISGREPIRFGCTPELTKLVLKSDRRD